MKSNNLWLVIVFFSLYFTTYIYAHEQQKASTLANKQIMLILAQAQANRKKNLGLLLGSEQLPSDSHIKVTIKNNPDNANTAGTNSSTQTTTQSFSTTENQKESHAPHPTLTIPYYKIFYNTLLIGTYVTATGAAITSAPTLPIIIPLTFACKSMLPLTVGLIACNGMI